MSKSIMASEEAIEKYQSLTEILSLEDLVIVGQEFDEFEERYYFLCVSKWQIAVCPDCGNVSSEIHDYPKQRRIHDTPVGGYPTCLVFDSHRFTCKSCQKPFTQTIRDVVPECTYTYRLAREIANPRRKQDVASLSYTYQLGYKLVEDILLKAAKLKLEKRSQAPMVIKHLGIDEISQHKGHGDYVLVLTDLDRRLLLDILPDRSKQGLIAWLRTPPAGIDLAALVSVATDLWSHYRDAVAAVFPHVPVVADRFHVVQNLHKAVHEARRQAQNQAQTEEEKQQLKGLRYLLLKNQHNLTNKDKERLAQLQQSHPNLYQLWLLRQRLYDWYETDTTPQLAQPDLLTWIDDAHLLPFPSLHTFCNTLTNWSSQILNFFTHRITSGFVEGMNAKIRLLKRIAFGLPNFDNFRLRMLWACG